MEIIRRKCQIDGMEIEMVEAFKYLGMTITREGKMIEDINKRIRAPNRCLCSLMTPLERSSISEKTELKIYNTVRRPVLIYSCKALSLIKEQEEKF